MDWLNYHHLFYFWTIAKHGSINQAARDLKLRQPTLSAQLSSLERFLGEKLFERKSRKMILTEIGQVVFLYAADIFTIGTELKSVLKNKNYTKTQTITIGVVDTIPKLITYRILRSAILNHSNVKIICKEDSLQNMIADLSVHQIDAILSDSPLPIGLPIKAFNHNLGESGVSFMAISKLKNKVKKNFPLSLTGAPLILPTQNTALRGQVDHWLASKQIYPNVVGEFEDSALLKMFAKEGIGICICPTAIEKEVKVQYKLEPIGRVNEIKERFFLISASRKINNPYVSMMYELAQNAFFK